MDEHHSWYNASVWHKDWPYQVYVGQWPIFYGPAILLHILKIIWWRNVLGIMDQCDSKIDLLKYISHISWSIDFALYHCHRLKLFLYIMKWHRSGVFVPDQALALVILAGNKDMYKISDEFEFRPDRTTDYRVNCLWASKKFPIDL